jgi:hypothetical protein
MVIIQDENVLLLHQSVKDYLVGAGSGHFIDELEAHAHLAYRCVDLLIQQFHGRSQLNIDFLTYATHHRANHAYMAQSRFEVMDSQAEFFEMNSPCREQWLEDLRSDHHSGLYFGDSTTILHSARSSTLGSFPSSGLYLSLG